MRIFVTAGNTQVPIDRVRCITNIFSGRTGAAIALEAHRRGHHVCLATSHPEVIAPPPTPVGWECHSYRTFDQLETLMARYLADAKQDVVVHCAAVSDYLTGGIYAPAPGTTFDLALSVWNADRSAPTLLGRSAGKVKSDEPELWLRLVRAPKLVDKIRNDWRFDGILVKFKLEVGVNENELQAIAEQSRQHSAANWMVANTLEGAGEWALLGRAQAYKKVTRAELASALLDVIESEAPHG